MVMKRKRYFILLEAFTVIIVLMMLAWVFIPKFLASQNINTPKNFPDPQVRAAVEKFMEVEPGGYFNQRMADEKTGLMELTLTANSISHHENHHDFYNSQSSGNTAIKGLSGFDGLPRFPNITGFSFVVDLPVTAFNLSQHPNLKEFKIWGGSIQSVSFAVCPDIETIQLQYGKLQEIDLSHNIKLQNLNVDYNRLTALEVSVNTGLESLNCNRNQIKKLDVSMLPKLYYLLCYGNELTELNLSQNPNISRIDISNNPLETIDLSHQSHLQSLLVDDEQLLHAKIILHPTAKPMIELRKMNGSNASLFDYPPDMQEKLQARIDELLGSVPTPDSATHPN